MVMRNAVHLASENRDLRAANQKQKRKREKPRAYIANGGNLTAQEGLRRAEMRVVANAGRKTVGYVSPDLPRSLTNQPCYHTTYLTLPRYHEVKSSMGDKHKVITTNLI